MNLEFLSLDFFALTVGYAVILVGSISALLCVLYILINIAWKNFVDLKAFYSVVDQARSQGKSLWK